MTELRKKSVFLDRVWLLLVAVIIVFVILLVLFGEACGPP